MKKIVRGLAAFIALLTIMTAFGMTGHHAFAAGAPTYIPPASVTTLSADFVRLFGEDRYKTNIAVCEECYQTSEFAVLASGRDFADALSGTPLAYMLEAPVLLTRGEAERLEPDVLAQLSRLETKTVYILGGTAAISGGIENHLESSGYNVTRLFGEDRYATAVEVAKEMDDKRGEAAGAFVMADGRNFPDALAITPVAALKGWPILFTPGDVEGLNKNSETYFVDKGIEDAIIVGGTGVVPDSAEARITALGVSAERVYGEDRYWTAAAIATRFKDDFTGTGVGVATGLAFPDALSGSGLAAKYSIPLILLNGKGVVSVPAKNALLNTGASTVYAFGGEAVLGNNVLRAHGVPLQSISLAFSQKYYYVDQGKTLNIAINVGSTGYTVSYSSDGPGAPVSSAGVVTGNTAGLYRITATCDGVSATADVAVLAPKKDGVPQYTVSNDGLQFIITWEGGASGDGNFRPYKDAGGYWTIGYGHAMLSSAALAIPDTPEGREQIIALMNEDIELLIGSEYIMTAEAPYLTQAGALLLLGADMEKKEYVSAINDWAKRNGIYLTQNQFDALVSLAYNRGPNYWKRDADMFYLKSAIMCYRDGRLTKPEQIMAGFTANERNFLSSSSGKYLKGLWYRRCYEAELFSNGVYKIDRSNDKNYPPPTNIPWS